MPSVGSAKHAYLFVYRGEGNIVQCPSGLNTIIDLLYSNAGCTGDVRSLMQVSIRVIHSSDLEAYFELI